METSAKLLVYVQAVPKTLPSGVRKFSDLSRSEFVLTHSSKTLLANARKLFPLREIASAGYHAILREALARGADKAISLPLCDDPLDQAKSLPTGDLYSHILVGENPDGPFSGASLCGALAALRKMDLSVIDRSSGSEAVHRTGIFLVRDEGPPNNIDIRRIGYSLKQTFVVSQVRGNSSLEKGEDSKREVIGADSAQEIAASFSRRLRRLAIQ